MPVQRGVHQQDRLMSCSFRAVRSSGVEGFAQDCRLLFDHALHASRARRDCNGRAGGRDRRRYSSRRVRLAVARAEWRADQ